MNSERSPISGVIAGRYDVRREVGRGGNAIVYLAWDLPHDRPIALKVLRPEIGLFLGADRFLREIQIAAHLAHPHILGVLDSGVAQVEGGPPLPYYVMPFLEGRSLAEHLGARRQLPVPEALLIAAEVADALQYAHARGVVHRDIKPANILLQEGHALVADFGIARMLVEHPATATSAGLAVGTPHYMSPEQFTAQSPVDGRSDVYSLGCVLYEMLAGVPPFTGTTPQAISAQHQVNPPRDLALVRPDLPRELARVVNRSLAKDPASRFAALEFRDELNRLRATGGQAARVLPLRSTTRLSRLVLGGALAVALVALGLRRWGGGDSPPVEAGPTRILVTYFLDQAGGVNSDLADALTVAVTDRLQAVPDLAVTASSAVAPFRNAPLDTLVARFPVDRVVTGAVSRSGDSTRVAVRVVDPATGRQLASSTFTSGASAGAAAMGEDVSAFVRRTLWEELEGQARRRQVSAAEAWTLVEQASSLRVEADEAIMFRADREGFKALDRADSLLALAARRDPRSSLIPLEVARTAERRAFLAEFVAQDLKQGMTGLPDPVAARSAALATVDATLRDHPRNAAGHAGRGVILMGLHRTLGADSLLLAAIHALEQARSLDPRATDAWTELGRAYRLAGRYPESQLAISQAAKVDAFQVHRLDLLRLRFEAALLATDYAGADSLCRAGLRESPGDERFSDCEVELWGRSRSDGASAARALAITDSLARVERGALFTAARSLWVAAILARTSLGDSADRVVARALAVVPPEEMRSMLLVEAANIRLLRGDPDSALALIAVAVRMNRAEVPYVSAAPWFDEARKDPRFGAALRGISPREAGTRR